MTPLLLLRRRLAPEFFLGAAVEYDAAPTR